MFKRLYAIIAIILASATIFLLTLISTTDQDKIHQEIEAKTKIKLPVDAKNMEMHLFPRPYILISEITSEQDLDLQDIRIDLSLFESLITLSPKIEQISIGQAKIYLHNEQFHFSKHSILANQISQLDYDVKSIKISNLLLEEVNSATSNRFYNVIMKLQGPDKSISGLFEDDQYFSALSHRKTTEKNNEIDFTLDVKKLEKDYITLKEQYKDGQLKTGTLKLIINRIPLRFAYYLQNYALPIYPVYFTTNLNISTDIIGLENGIMLDNMLISSDALQGKAKMKFIYGDKNSDEISMSFNKIDLSYARVDTGGNNKRFLLYDRAEGVNFADNSLSLAFMANEITLSPENKLYNVKFNSGVEGDRLLVKEFSAKINETGKFALTGAVSQDEFRSLFDGHIEFNHNNINDILSWWAPEENKAQGNGNNKNDHGSVSYSSDLQFNAINYNLNNIKLVSTKYAKGNQKLDQSYDITGNASIKLIGDTPRTRSSLRLSLLDLDQANVPILSSLFNQAKAIFLNSKNENYTEYLMPIRSISTIGEHELLIDTIILGGKIYKNISCIIAASANNFSLYNVKLSEGGSFINFDLIINTGDIKPNITIFLRDGDLHNFRLSAPSVMNLRDKILKILDLNKINFVIKGKLVSLGDDLLTMKNVKLDLRNDMQVIKLEDCSADIFNGNLELSGNVVLEPYNLNLVYALNSASLPEISKLLPKNLAQNQGLISTSGMISTQGNSMKEQLYNLYTKSVLVAKDVMINSMSIDDFIARLSGRSYDPANLEDDLNLMLLTGKTRIVDLKTNLGLSKGVFSFSSLLLKTENSSITGNGQFNIYDFNIKTESELSFHLPGYIDDKNLDIMKIGVTANGLLLNPKKAAQTERLQQYLKEKR